MDFQTTHRAGPHGAPTWPTADPAAPPGPRLDPGLDVQVLERTGDWARVRCANGWEAWTDGRWLDPVTATAAPATTPAPAPRPYAAPPTRGAATRPTGVTTGAVQAHEVVGAAGALVALLGAFLPWYKAPGFDASINGFDIAFWALVTGNASDAEPKAGLLVVLGALAAGALIGLGRATVVPAWSFAVAGAVAGVPALLGVYRLLDEPQPRPDLGLGLVLALAGGVAIAATAAVPRPHR